MAQLLVYDDNEDGGDANPTPASIGIKDPPKFLVHFRRNDNYEGEYGFDWLRDEYIDEKQPLCKSDIEKLKKEYEALEPISGKHYYVPYLSMFVNHNTRVGKAVNLTLVVDVLDNKWKDAKIKFEHPHFIKIEPSELKIKKGEKKDVQIFCNEEHNGCEIIIKTIADKKNPNEVNVGKLKLIPNTIHPLSIRIVKVLREEYELQDEQDIDSKIPKKLIDYFNKNSLQQSLFEVSMLPEVKVIINEQNGIQDGYLIQNGNDTLISGKYTNSPYPHKRSHTFIYNECKKQNLNEDLTKGIVVLVSNLNVSDPAAGEAMYNPTKDNYCIIYAGGYEKNYAYVHEIGHVLGLSESFKDLLNATNRNIYHNNISVHQNKIITENAKNLPNSQILQELQDKLDYAQDYVDGYDEMILRPLHLYEYTKIDNFMDYYLPLSIKNSLEKKSFFYWQIKIMQDDYQKYHK